MPYYVFGHNGRKIGKQQRWRQVLFDALDVVPVVVCRPRLDGRGDVGPPLVQDVVKSQRGQLFGLAFGGCLRLLPDFIPQHIGGGALGLPAVAVQGNAHNGIAARSRIHESLAVFIPCSFGVRNFYNPHSVYPFQNDLLLVVTSVNARRKLILWVLVNCPAADAAGLFFVLWDRVVFGDLRGYGILA